MGAHVKEWGKDPDGCVVKLYTFFSDRLSFTVSDLGGIITSIIVPDKKGIMGDVALGYDTVEAYLEDDAYVGAMIGRFANRIGGARFTLNGTDYKLTANQGENQLHGGGGFHRKLWQASDVTDDGMSLRLQSPDGEDGYPGSLDVIIRIKIDENRVNMDFSATSDKDTYLNMTNHAYFNLHGAGNGDVLGHVARINANKVTPTDKQLIPTGEIVAVQGTAYDFTEARVIGNAEYDINYVLDGGTEEAAEVCDPVSGRLLRVFTDMPCIQFYVGGQMTRRCGKEGQTYLRNSGFCLEPQYFPNGPNVPGFNGGLLMAGQMYKHRITYEFA